MTSTPSELVEQLKQLGVSDKTARYALERYNNDLTRAANYVFSGAASKDEVSGSNPVEDHKVSLLPPLSPPGNLQSERSSDNQASDLILGAVERGRSSRSSFLGIRRGTSPSTPPRSQEDAKQPPTLIQPSKPVGGEKSGSKYRAPSPFFRARRSREKARARDTSPEVGPLAKDVESDIEEGEPRKFRPQASAYDDDSGTEASDDSDSGEDLSDGEFIYFDEETEKNTEANAIFLEGDAVDAETNVLDRFGEETEQDVLGEGPNVVVPPPSVFAAPNPTAPKRRKSMRSGHEMVTSRPSFARDRCTITLTQGDPDRALELSGKRMRRYVVLSDLSDESRYAVEWAIGTVVRDGDEVFLISVKEDESKVDPKNWSDSDRSSKIKVQKERQTTALLLVRQVTSLLQRTSLNITVTCQFLHAKNARHMLLDLIDFLDPTMAIVGSRGLGQLKGILLGSTSHYLVQKSSVPVMVARRRLHRPLRKTNPADLRHSPRVSLASASIEKTASSKQEDEIVDVAEEPVQEIPQGGDGEGK